MTRNPYAKKPSETSEVGMRSSVTLLHPWLPAYRVPFFSSLIEWLAREQVDLEVWYGAAPPEVVARKDATYPTWARRSPTRFVRVGNRTLSFHALPRRSLRADLLIMEQAIRNVETYPALARSMARGTPLALWGHGRTYTKAHSSLEEQWKRMLTLRARWFFAYTQGGAELVVADGFSRERVTVVQNSVSTDEIDAARRQTETFEIEAFRARHSLVDGQTALFVGGLDDSKRLPFLFEASRRIRRQWPSFKLVVAGDGDLRRHVEGVSNEGWLVYVGRATDPEKGVLAEACNLMLMPGRVGLGLVDSFAMETPLVTTAWPYHAPEFEYLVDGYNGVVTADDLESYSSRVSALLGQPYEIERLREGCRASCNKYSMDTMVNNFGLGVLSALQHAARS
jgi:glycosyltransferase involved in cell wall biosynthesis